jgi:predicted secreted protein
VQPADLASWTKYAAWQFTGTGVASDYGVYHAKNQIDESRSKSLDYLRIPPAVTNLSVVQTSDTSVTVTFDKPTIVDYLGADLYVNNVWKKWINDSGVTQQSTTFDVTNYPKDTYIQFGVEIEDYCSDFSPMNSLNIKLVTAPTDPVPTPPPTTDPTVTDPPPPDPTTTLTPITESDVVLMPIAAMGTTIKKSTGSAIAGLTEIGGLELSSDTIDTTTLDSTGGYRQFMTSFKDAGEVSLSGHFEYTSHSTILDDFESGTTASYTITFPNGASWIFDGVVTKFQTGFSLEDLISFEATIKVSGAPTLTAPTP